MELETIKSVADEVSEVVEQTAAQKEAAEKAERLFTKFATGKLSYKEWRQLPNAFRTAYVFKFGTPLTKDEQKRKAKQAQKKRAKRKIVKASKRRNRK